MTNDTNSLFEPPVGVRITSPATVTRPEEHILRQYQDRASIGFRDFTLPSRQIDPRLFEELARQMTDTSARRTTQSVTAERPRQVLPKEAIPLFLELIKAERERCLLIQNVDERDTALGNLVDCDSQVFDRLKASVIAYWAIFG